MEVFPAPEGAVMMMILLLEAMRKDGEKKILTDSYQLIDRKR